MEATQKKTRRPGAGRPPTISGPKERINAYVALEHADMLREIGAGVVADGLRLALDSVHAMRKKIIGKVVDTPD